MNDETVRAVAHHEATHVVVACVLGLALGEKGASVFGMPPDPTGQAFFEGATRGCTVAPEKTDNVVIALLAGGIAHRRFQENVRTAVLMDERRIAELFGQTDFASAEVQERCTFLRERAEELVETHWPEIQRVASELCSQKWHFPNPHSGYYKEKTLTGQELKDLLPELSVRLDAAFDN